MKTKVQNIIDYLQTLDPDMDVKITNSAGWFGDEAWDVDMSDIIEHYLPVKGNLKDKKSRKDLKPVLIIHDICRADY